MRVSPPTVLERARVSAGHQFELRPCGEQGHDAAGQVRGVEAGLAQHPVRQVGPEAALAVHAHRTPVGRGPDLLDPATQLGVRDVQRALEVPPDELSAAADVCLLYTSDAAD